MGLVAAADLGSNNFRLVVADEVGPGEFREVLILNRIVRAGQGIGAGGCVAPEALSRVEGCLKEFGAELDRIGVLKRHAMLTAAGRDLTDGGVYAEMARRQLRAEVGIPTGVEEAALSLRGAAGLLGFPPDKCTMLDIGGGSTEIAWTSDRGTEYESLKLGVVRLTEELRVGYLAGEQGFRMLKESAERVFASSRYLEEATSGGNQGMLVVTAGTALTLAAYLSGKTISDTRRLTGTQMDRAGVEKFSIQLSGLDLGGIAALPCLVAGREDVITAGLAILAAFMEASGFPSCVASDGGLAEGLLFANSSAFSGSIRFFAKDVV